VILTALPVEYKAVRAHLEDIEEIRHEKGTVYEKGQFTCPDNTSWTVIIVEIGAGNPNAAVETERAIASFEPAVALFVGVAGGIKDVSLLDLVVATKVYGYESGKENIKFQPRPDFGQPSYRLLQRAKAESRRDNWRSRLGANHATTSAQVHIGPIAAGEKVVSSRRSQIFKFLRESYSDALAVEMEGSGFLRSVYANENVQALLVRGISDLVTKKAASDAAGNQATASEIASAFAFEVLANLEPKGPCQEGKIIIVLSATIEEVDKSLAETIAAHLKRMSHDANMSLIRVEEGSVRLVLSASNEGYLKLRELHESGTLDEALGFIVSDIFWEMDDSERKWAIDSSSGEETNGPGSAPTPGQIWAIGKKIEMVLAENTDLKNQNAILSTELEINERVVNGFLESLGKQQVPRERWAFALAELSVDHKRLLRNLELEAATDSASHESEGAAKDAVESGDYATAESILRQRERLSLEAAESTATESTALKLKAATIRAMRGDIAMAQIEYDVAVRHYRSAADIAKDVDVESYVLFLFRLRDSLYRQGVEKGEGESLRKAINVSKELLGTLSFNIAPLNWVMAMSDLGTTLSELGEREGASGRALLREAVAIYGEAIKKLPKELDPLLWGKTQSNLGSALRAIFEREGQSDVLLEAITAYGHAQSAITRDKSPFDWALVQSNLGNVLRIHAELEENGVDSLERAIVACRESLSVITRDNAPLDWAGIHLNLGNALAGLSILRGDLGGLLEARSSYREALNVWTRERVPLLWASAQCSSSAVSIEIGRRSEGITWFEEAFSECQEALKEYTFDKTPVDWAGVQFNAGFALLWIGTRSNDIESLRGAQKRMQSALDVYKEANHRKSEMVRNSIQIVAQMIDTKQKRTE
jgi:nucleoside phosphorylase/tetratricopeptide (TPR) repeat protein